MEKIKAIVRNSQSVSAKLSGNQRISGQIAGSASKYYYTKVEIDEFNRILQENIDKSGHFLTYEIEDRLLILNLIDNNENVISSISINLDENLGDFISDVEYDTEENLLVFTYKSGDIESFEIGGGNVSIYYNDTLPEDASKLKKGDLYFEEN